MTLEHQHDHDHDHDHEHGGHEHVAYPEAIARFRADKDDYFRSAHDSPIPHEARHDFPGLAYFPVDESLRFEGVTLEPYTGTEPARFQIPTSDGKLQPAVRAGVYRFPIGGQIRCSQVRLTAGTCGNGGAGSTTPCSIA